MFFDSMQFNAMRASLDALQIKQNVVSHNIANYETPGYKARKVGFEEVFNNAREGKSGDYRFRATVTTENDTEIRPDGNNVDLDKEQMELFDSYMQSVYLYQKIGGQFTNMRYILNQQMR